MYIMGKCFPGRAGVAERLRRLARHNVPGGHARKEMRPERTREMAGFRDVSIVPPGRIPTGRQPPGTLSPAHFRRRSATQPSFAPFYKRRGTISLPQKAKNRVFQGFSSFQGHKASLQCHFAVCDATFQYCNVPPQFATWHFNMATWLRSLRRHISSLQCTLAVCFRASQVCNATFQYCDATPQFAMLHFHMATWLRSLRRGFGSFR